MRTLLSLIRKIFFKKKYKTYTDKEIENYFFALLKCAELDIISSNSLNSEKRKAYSVILYHIQQAIEKMTKAELLHRKLISIDQLKEINHKTPSAFMFSLISAMEDKQINSFIKARVPQESLNEAKKLIKNPNKIINFSEQELKVVIGYYEIFKNSRIPDTLYSEAQKELPPEKIKDYSKERADIFMNLYFLSWITFPHEELTRYPNGKINPFDYTNEKPIIKVLPQLLETTNKIYSDIKKFYKINGEKEI